MYADEIRALLTSQERRLFTSLSSPQKIQDFLDTLPINFELDGPTQYSPRTLLSKRIAHCLEGAIFAAAVLAYHGKAAYLMDFRAPPDEEDHVIAPFVIGGYWGAISKTNHSVLRYRDPVYRDYRELAMSYFHEYIAPSKRRTLIDFSAPFDLRRFKPVRWVATEEDLSWVAIALDKSRHFPAVPKKNRRKLRKATETEWVGSEVKEWKAPRRATRRS